MPYSHSHQRLKMPAIKGRHLAMDVVLVNWLLLGGAAIFVSFIVNDAIHTGMSITTHALKSFFNRINNGTINSFNISDINIMFNVESEEQGLLVIAGAFSPGGILLHTMMNVLLTVGVIKADRCQLTIWIAMSVISFFVSVFLYIKTATMERSGEVVVGIWVEFIRITWTGLSILAVYYFRDRVVIFEDVLNEAKSEKRSKVFKA